MEPSTEEIFLSLVDHVSDLLGVQSIGLSSSKNPLPKPGEGDIDIFIYCDTIPGSSKREETLRRMAGQLKAVKTGVFEGGHWGLADYALIKGVETWMMYFTCDDTLKEVESIRNGEYPDKLDNYYYPVGRCAMLKNINILYDRSGFLSSLSQRLSDYPAELSKLLTEYHLDKLRDTEDLERAVTRKDVLFYHFAMDIALDHFLQALFAVNKTWFPSRKRSIQYIQGFKRKPESCAERILEAVERGGSPEGIARSYEIWSGLVEDLSRLGT